MKMLSTHSAGIGSRPSNL